MFKSFRSLAVVFIAAIVGVQAEHHTVHFDNRCGFGTPTLVRAGQILSTGGDFSINGPLTATIAYLQTGNCGLNGERCTLIETTLINPTSPGSGSSTDISLIPPLAFSVTSGFGYFNGCDGAGARCDNGNCNTAFHVPSDTHVQVACQTNDCQLECEWYAQLPLSASKYGQVVNVHTSIPVITGSKINIEIRRSTTPGKRVILVQGPC